MILISYDLLLYFNPHGSKLATRGFPKAMRLEEGATLVLDGVAGIMDEMPIYILQNYQINAYFCIYRHSFFIKRRVHTCQTITMNYGHVNYNL